jgi:PPM family protein phosphatase
MYDIASASLTDTGKVREINEDSVLEAGNLFAVADGMGGHQAGEVASDLALSLIGQYVEDNLGLVGGEKLVEKAVSSANASVHQKARSSAKYHSMGTTVTLLYREGDTAYIGNVGDSRTYLLRAGSLRRLTRDHSLVQALIDEGEITEEQARNHPQRNIIIRALGLEPQIDVDVVSVKIEPGDEFLLASDGLTGMVDDAGIAGVLVENSEPVAAARALVDLALAAGGNDNISVVVVSIKESATVVPSHAGPGEVEQGSETAAIKPQDGLGGRGRNERRRTTRWVIAVALIVVLLGAAIGVVAYLYNKTYYVAERDGKVTLFKGFPFWDLGMVVRKTDTDTRFLPTALRQRVEGKLDPESRHDAEKTIAMLERQAAKYSVIVPRVEGKKLKQAKAALESVGLRAKVELVSRPTIAANTVLDQDPVPGTRLGVGSEVKLKVVMAGSPAKEV